MTYIEGRSLCWNEAIVSSKPLPYQQEHINLQVLTGTIQTLSRRRLFSLQIEDLGSALSLASNLKKGEAKMV